jgi:hypothetical protein
VSAATVLNVRLVTVAHYMHSILTGRIFTMSTTSLVILIGVILIAAIAVWGFLLQRRSTKLRSRFGPEYESAIHEYGDRSRAEKELARRAERTENYHIRAISKEEQQRFTDEWRRTQAHFVDDPPLAIHDADHLVCEVMQLRGYPMADFDRRAEDLSVDHPGLIRTYRTAHEIAVTQAEGRATTEDLRRAMVYYRELFDELLETHPAAMPERRA